MKEKQCILCGEKKDINAFYERKDSKDGRRNSCCSCDKGRNKNRHKHICPTCKNTFFGQKHQICCSRECYEKRTKGVEKITTDGYVLCQSPSHSRANKYGYVLQHILVLEKELGRLISFGEEVRHINGDRADNRIENLLLFKNKSEHRKWHIKEKYGNKNNKGTHDTED